MSYNPPSTLSIYRKISQIGLACMLIAVLLMLSLSSRMEGKNLLQQQSTEMAQVLISSVTPSIIMQFDDEESLPLLVNKIAEDEHIAEIVVYDKTGNIIAESTEALRVKDRPLLDDENEIVHYTRELYDQAELIGYARLSLEMGKLSNATVKEQDQLLSQYRLMLIIGFVIAFLLTRGFSRFGEALSKA